MNAWILRTLRADARAWWYHTALRDRGETGEAEARERAAIRSDLDVIRKTLATRGAYVSTGAGGTTIHYAKGCTLQGYARLRHMAVARVLVEIGLPLIDTTPVADTGRLINLPRVAVGHDPDPEPWTGLSYAPLGAYAARARALGAVVANWPRGGDRPAA